jgi:hypothetical protein
VRPSDAVARVRRAGWHAAAWVCGARLRGHGARRHTARGTRWRRVGWRGRAGPRSACDRGRSVLPVSLSLPLFISLTHLSLLFADLQPVGPSPVTAGPDLAMAKLDLATAGLDPVTISPDLATAGSLKLDATVWA